MNFPLKSGSVIGIMGGGQLGRMTALAAAPLGYDCHIYTTEADSPAARVSAAATVAPWDDTDALHAFAHGVDIVTFEFENVPHTSLQLLASTVPIRPGINALQIAQDRLLEKKFFNDLGLDTVPWHKVGTLSELTHCLQDLGTPCILKTCRMGYDGKGQRIIRRVEDSQQAWQELFADNTGNFTGNAILEGFADIATELSIIIARTASGERAVYPPCVNIHKNHILHLTRAPADIPVPLADKVERAALKIADALALEGLLCIEMFVLEDGTLLMNEMAPRPHNSGHWTIDACYTSQFEQFVRAVCGLPLGTTDYHHRAEMVNLLGDEPDYDPNRLKDYLRESHTAVHLYGKGDPRPGRKMGHLTRLLAK